MHASRLKASLPASFAMLTNPGVRHAYNEAFVAAELRRFQPFFDDVGGRSLSDQQRQACIRLEDNNLLIASAGSGKSATIVGKVAYVLERALYRPEEILVLAYNMSAADELKARIARQLRSKENELKCRVTDVLVKIRHVSADCMAASGRVTFHPRVSRRPEFCR